MAELLDCAIVGAGPAGLTAATYLARFRRNIHVFDAGNSRARYIPLSHNCPGFPEGVSGAELLQRLRAQAARERLDAAGIACVESLVKRIAVTAQCRVAVHTADDAEHTFDTLYPVLGSRMRSELALALGARCSQAGDIFVDDHMRTSVPGL